MSTTILDLPTEIISQIDHYLYSENDRLACLSVCSKWYYLFRRKLYHSIRISDQAQFQRFYQRCFNVGHLVKVLDLSEMMTIQPADLYSIPTLCPKLQSIHFNLWDQFDNLDKSVDMMSKLSLLYSISTLDLHKTSSIGYRLLQTCSKILTDITLSVCLPLQLIPMQQLESLSINIQYESMCSTSISDLEYIHSCYPNLKSLCIHGSNEFIPFNNDRTVISKSRIQPCMLTSFKFNQIQNNFDPKQAQWIHYICTKYPLLQTLELESPYNAEEASSNSHSLSWHQLAFQCIHLQRLVLFGYTLDQKFFSVLSKHKLNMKALKLSTVTHSMHHQPPLVPISSILKQYKDTLQELVFWPCHIIRPTYDLFHPNLQLCHRLHKLSLSGIHLYNGDDVHLDIPVDTLIQYGIHLRYLKLEYLSLSSYSSSKQHTRRTTRLAHVSLQHVALSNGVIDYLSTTCPHITHLSLVYCRFLNRTINISMPHQHLDFFNLHYPYSMYHASLPSTKYDYLFQLNSDYYTLKKDSTLIRTTADCWTEKEAAFNIKNNIIIQVQYCSIDQFYIFGKRINIVNK